MYALSEGNFGTAYRHRGEASWALALFAAVGAHAIVLWAAARVRAGRRPADSTVLVAERV